MALTPCPECENQISEMATTCPHCGFPVAAQRSTGVDRESTQTPHPQARKRSSGNLLAAIPTLLVGFALIVYGPSFWFGIAVMAVGAWLFGKWMREPREDFTRHLQIAADPAANSAWLEEISHSPNATLRTQVALNSNTPTPTLERLARDTNPEVAAEATARLRERQTQDGGQSAN